MSRSRSASLRLDLEAPLRRPGLVVAPAVMLALAAAAAAFLLPATYRAEAVVRAQWGGPGADTPGAAVPELGERRAGAVRQRLFSRDLLERTLAEAKPYAGAGATSAPGEQVERLRSDLRVRPLSASTFAVEYVHREPATAARVVNVLATLLARDSGGAVPRGDPIAGLELVAPAVAPATPEGPSFLGLAAVGALLGLLLGLAAAVVADRRDPSVKGPEDLEQILPVPLLATVPELRAGERDPVSRA